MVACDAGMQTAEGGEPERADYGEKQPPGLDIAGLLDEHAAEEPRRGRHECEERDCGQGRADREPRAAGLADDSASGISAETERGGTDHRGYGQCDEARY